MDWKSEVKSLFESKATNVLFLATPDEMRVDDLIYYLERDYSVIATYDPYHGLETLKPSDKTDNVGRIGLEKLGYTEQKEFSPMNPTAYIQFFEKVMREHRSLFIFYNANRLVKDLQFNLLWSAILSIRRNPSNYEKLSGFIFVFPTLDDVDGEILQKTFAVKTALPSRDDFQKALDASNNQLKEKSKKSIEIVDGDITGLFNAAGGMTLTQFENILIHLYNFHDGKVSVNDIMGYKAEIVEAGGLITVKRSKYTLEDYAGQQKIKDFLNERVINIIKQAERARKLGVRIPRGIAFVGNPRTGKTFLGECFSGDLSMPVFEIKGSNLVSKWYGEAEQQTQRAIEQIDKNSPCVILWDIDFWSF